MDKPSWWSKEMLTETEVGQARQPRMEVSDTRALLQPGEPVSREERKLRSRASSFREDPEMEQWVKRSDEGKSVPTSKRMSIGMYRNAKAAAQELAAKDT